ncbi:hypothetical protein M595_0171 [Lyngbya aestuarii BL J]|uniref:Uncharacterized protein n=1 Tax=Lyngbya aestuarii BL J TaxID=1348334 RepID=U7QRV6_9CYAN|nr:hypothetical protein M595_0171 [Lyngbya aestuarii BL J]
MSGLGHWGLMQHLMVLRGDYLFLFCPNFRKINPFPFV